MKQTSCLAWGPSFKRSEPFRFFLLRCLARIQTVYSLQREETRPGIRLRTHLLAASRNSAQIRQGMIQQAKIYGATKGPNPALPCASCGPMVSDHDSSGPGFSGLHPTSQAMRTSLWCALRKESVNKTRARLGLSIYFQGFRLVASNQPFDRTFRSLP